MVALNGSGSSTPLSSSITLSSPPSPRLKHDLALQESFYNNPHVQLSTIVEHIASQKCNSSFVYVFDVAEQVGFGTLTKSWGQAGRTAPVVDLQTRAGAGLSLVGRLSQGTSVDAGNSAVLTAYTTPAGLALMIPSLVHLPPASAESRLVVQVPTVVSTGESLSLSPSLASLTSSWPLLPEGLVVLLSSTPKQAVDFANLAYQFKGSHIIHLFDHYTSGREFGHSIRPAEDLASPTTVTEAISRAGYQFFDYVGDVDAHTVLVLLNGPLALAAQTLGKKNTSGGLGVVTVNVLRPWDEDTLRAVVPPSVKVVHVFDDVPNVLTQGNLYGDVFSALWTPTGSLSIHPRRIIPSQTQQFLNNIGSFPAYVSSLIPSFNSPADIQVPDSKRLLLLSNPQSPLSTLSHVVESLFATKSIHARLLIDHDIFSKAGGITISRLLLSSAKDSHNLLPLSLEVPLEASSSGSADFIGILDQSLLSSHEVFNLAKQGSVALIVTAWTAEELAANLPPATISHIIEKDISIFTLNAKDVATKLAGAPGPIHDALQNIVTYLAFLRLYLGGVASEPLVLKLAERLFNDNFEGISLAKISSHTWSGLGEVEFAPISEPGSTNLQNIEANAIVVETELGDTLVNGAKLGSWHDAAKHLLFPSIYAPSDISFSDESAQNPSLRPEIPDRTYLVTCTVNRRLTPLEYDRNVFHLEFDTTGTNLKYSLGEALGVHGWNDEQEVLDFCTWYGVDPNHLVTIPIPGDDKLHTRTVFQALQQQVDLFGRPTKSFYTDLAAYASAPVDRYALLFIGSPEGSATFKKLSEKDTVNFADILRSYPSAKPGIEKLCELIGDIKPRHYSIASSQAVVGNRVDLLVVTVDWLTPNGTSRYGQCTRYLAGLKIGQKVTVSIKPSVMKLPPNPKQPIIMAGLGTGAAPFRAFLQHLAWLAEQGQEIGPVYYYFGSRHQSQEYLYGEEIEAWILDGVVTRAGLAFSRDGKNKVYIQHKMLEDSEALAKMLYDQEGAFYLCGPTWPVPDVYEALVEAMVKYKGITTTVAGNYLEGLKEEERYVLEVY